MSTEINLPPPPDPVKVAQWVSTGLSILKAAAGAGLVGTAWAASVSPEKMTAFITFLMYAMSVAALVVGWLGSLWQRHLEAVAARKVLVASAVASAQHGAPVVVTVTPTGEPNIATRISPAEQVAAPSVPLGVAPQSAPVTP
jgi:hypothetical protein